MLSIRMQRLGRKGKPTYRVVVQDRRQAPTSGKYIALLGSYDPHTKQTSLVKEKAEYYLKNGAEPSERVVKLFKSEKISIPKWVSKPEKQKRDIKNLDKLRRNRSAEEKPKQEAEEAKPEASDSVEAASSDVSEEKPAAEVTADKAEPEEPKDSKSDKKEA